MAKPILDVCCIMEPGCEYPVAVRLWMDDNTAQTYNLDCKDELRFQKVIDSVNVSVGYTFKCIPKRVKNRIHRRHDEHG